jgi:CubicO group peptidase (beta-lactamase class C family)
MASHFRVHRNFGTTAIACALVFTAVALAQDIVSTKPESVGLSSERLDRIGTAVQHSIDEKQIAGAVTMVVRHGRVAWFRAQGMMDREADKAMRPDAMFRICSMTKPITSVAVMMMYEEGRFQLGDPISKYLPKFKNPKVFVKPATGQPYTIPAAREITIRDLLRHTSGLTYNWNTTWARPMYDANVASGFSLTTGRSATAYRRLASCRSCFNPGERFEYSLSVDVLGRLVEVVSGMPLDRFLRTRILDPLGMKDTYFYPPSREGGAARCGLHLL